MDPLRAIAGRKVLVTGGTGTLGGAFVARAREAGAQVSAPTRAEGFDLRDRAAWPAWLPVFCQCSSSWFKLALALARN